jgi:hypothetical protein
LQLGGAVFRPPQTGGFANFARFAHSPNPFADFVLTPCAGRAFWRGCLARRAGPCWLAVVTETPLGHCFGPRVETPHRTLLGSDVVSVITPHRTVPISRFLAGANPPRGTGETCLTAVADSRGPVDQLHRPFPGCPGLSQGRHRSLFHYRGLQVIFRISQSLTTYSFPFYESPWIGSKKTEPFSQLTPTGFLAFYLSTSLRLEP